MDIIKKIGWLYHKIYDAWRMRARRCALCYAVYYPQQVLQRHKPLAHSLVHENICGLCPDCRPKVPQRKSGFCPYCGELMAVETLPCTPCSLCLSVAPPWKHFFFYGVYEKTLRDIVHAAKFGLDNTALGLAGELLCLACQPIWHEHIDVIVPVPLHISRLRERGANQCVEMARPLVQFLGVPMRLNLLKRVRATPHQLGLHAYERKRNLNNAFEVSADCKGLHILLVDDVMTTGTTLRRCVECLREAGAASVTVLVLARTKKY